MRIRSVHLKGYKRFTDLRISSVPESAHLVVLIGPNGSGKSSLFDAFLLKSGSNRNLGLDGAMSDYYQKSGFNDRVHQSTHDVLQDIEVDFHSRQPTTDQWPTTFYMRSAYRNESDFQLGSLERTRPAAETRRFNRIIDPDQAVSDNYRRMAWKRISDMDYDAPDETTFGQYRKESLGELRVAMATLFKDPTLGLESFGGVQDSGTFLFSKGASKRFRYSNLSGGEKAAFDLLLDIFVKRDEYQDAVYCIDEPEAHIATALQGPLLEAMLGLLPAEAQLWIATHSIGFVRQASDRMREKGDVVFLDFGGHDFDQAVEITPRPTDRGFWQETYAIALSDLSDLIAPKTIILCEGSKERADKGFDAECYNRIFSDVRPDALFISIGNNKQVERSQDLIAVLEAVSRGTEILRLIDRDEMPDEGRAKKVADGIRVLSRREIENYLYDPEVLRTFFTENGQTERGEELLIQSHDLVAADDLKDGLQDLFQAIRKGSGIRNLGNSLREFALYHLVPALTKTSSVLDELGQDVFPDYLREEQS